MSGGEMKVTEMAAQLQERLPVNRNSFMKFYDWYHRTYFKTNRFTPVFHAMVLAGVVGYSLEYPHIKHALEEERKKANEV